MGNAESVAGAVLGSCFAGIASAEGTAGAAVVIAPAAAAAVLLAIRGRTSPPDRAAWDTILGFAAGASLVVSVAVLSSDVGTVHHHDDSPNGHASVSDSEALAAGGSSESAGDSEADHRHGDVVFGPSSQAAESSNSADLPPWCASTAASAAFSRAPTAALDATHPALAAASAAEGSEESSDSLLAVPGRREEDDLPAPALGSASAHRDQHWYPPTGRAKERAPEAPDGLTVHRICVIRRGLYGGRRWKVASHSALLLDASGADEGAAAGTSAGAGARHRRRFIVEYGTEADPNKVAVRELPALANLSLDSAASRASGYLTNRAARQSEPEAAIATEAASSASAGAVTDVDGTIWEVASDVAIDLAASALGGPGVSDLSHGVHEVEVSERLVESRVEHGSTRTSLSVADVEAMLCEVVQGEEYHWAHHHHNEATPRHDDGRAAGDHVLCPLVRDAVQRRLGRFPGLRSSSEAAQLDGSGATPTQMVVQQLERALEEASHIALQRDHDGTAGGTASGEGRMAVTSAMSPRAHAQAARTAGVD